MLKILHGISKIQDINSYKKRLFEDKLIRMGQHFPVVVLTGARQVGKTTIFEHLLPHAEQVTFDLIK